MILGFTVTAKDAPFHVSDHESYADPRGAGITSLVGRHRKVGCVTATRPVRDRDR